MPTLFNPSRKPGRPSVLKVKVTTVSLTPEQIAWGKAQPGGLSNTVRRLLHNAMRNQRRL